MDYKEKYKYEKHILDLLDADKFEKKFWELCAEFSTRREAYESLERLYFTWFRRRRYSNWECFREIVNRNLRKSSQI
jgi:hypothetical protein